MGEGRAINIFFNKPFFDGQEKLLEMIPLPTVRNIDNVFCIPFFPAISNGGQVRGRVVAGSIGFTNNERLLGKALMFRMKYDKGPLILGANPMFL